MTRDEIGQFLGRHGVIPTSQRLDVGEVIFSKPQHLSAEQVITATRTAGSRISKATVYNTLNLFCEKGLVRTVNVDPERRFYDPTILPHHHFFNVDTGELTDIPMEGLSLDVKRELPPGTEQIGIEVVIQVRDQSPG